MIDYKDLIKSFTEEDFKQKKVNLHIHTHYSDGIGDFDSLVEQAESKGYKYIAITDHNTMKGYEENKKANSPILIPGVEFDVWCGYVFMHLLGYGVDRNHPELKKFFAKSERETKWDVIRLLSDRDIKELIKAIHAAGGIAILAHPACCWCLSMNRFVKKLVKFGLDGMEVYYPYPRFRGILKFHTAEKVKKIARLHNLIMTGGTDLHGEIIP